MSKMRELSLVVTELKRCGEALTGISDSLADLFCSQKDSPTLESSNVDTPEPQDVPITREALRAVLADKSRAGYSTEVRALLESHGAAKLSEINPSEFESLLAEAEVLGNG